MKIILSGNLNPYYNLAAEEVLLKNKPDDYIVLWRSKPCVVVGKHQNAWAETNFEYLQKNNIDLARRLSGGGTVYHDQGNVNFTFIMNGEEGNLVDFKRFTLPVIHFLEKLGLHTTFGGHNSLLYNGLKFSGNAEHVFKRRVLHHGTILFNADLGKLHEVINTPFQQYTDKAVKSVRASVTNLQPLLKGVSGIEDFIDKMVVFFHDYFQDIEKYQYTEEEEARVKSLANDKYRTWEWNYGYSPKYTLNRTFSYNGIPVSFKLEVKRGVIEKLTFQGEEAPDPLLQKIMEEFPGNQHRYGKLLEIVRKPGWIRLSSKENLGDVLLKLF